MNALVKFYPICEKIISLDIVTGIKINKRRTDMRTFILMTAIYLCKMTLVGGEHQEHGFSQKEP
jgi:hypothetical protein